MSVCMARMVSYRFPMTTEPNMLRTMIVPPSTLGRALAMVTGSAATASEISESALSGIPWRKQGVKYSNNEIYFDVVEEIDALFSSSGLVVSADVTGEVVCRCHLSGMPDLALTFTDPSVRTCGHVSMAKHEFVNVVAVATSCLRLSLIAHFILRCA